MSLPRIIIIGAGFAGLNAAKQFRNQDAQVLLIDQNNYHTFQPLLYQVATAGLETDDIAHQVRGIFRRQGNVRFLKAKVTGIDWDNKQVLLLNQESRGFDYLIIAVGAVYNDFGIPGVREHSFMLKSLTEATTIRSHILQQFENASAKSDHRNDGSLNFVIVGGGPTGVEMAGALLELFEHPLKNDFPELDLSMAKVFLVEMATELLTAYSKRSQLYAEKILRERGVDIRLTESVTEVNPDAVTLSSGLRIPTHTVIWAAGVRGHPLAERLGLELTRGYRIQVNNDLSIPNYPYAFVAGDLAGLPNAQGQLYPQVATVAIQQGQHVGRQILQRLKGQDSQAFHYFNKGSMAIIGRNAGIAELSKKLGGFHFRGFLGWLAWLFIHLIYLPGYQNRVVALANWAYNYLTYDRHKRLITSEAEDLPVPESKPILRPTNVLSEPERRPDKQESRTGHPN